MILDNHYFQNLQLNFNNNSKNYDPFDWVDKCRRFTVPHVCLNAKYKFVISKANQKKDTINLQKLEEITGQSSESGPMELTLAQSLDCLLPSENVSIKDVKYKVISKNINAQNEIVI